MARCFVVTFEGKDLVAFYELKDREISLVNNRHFSESVKDEMDARQKVCEHAPKFAQAQIKNIETLEIDLGLYHRSIARPIFPSKQGGLINLGFDGERPLVARVKREIAVLSNDLEECFDVSSPYPENFGVFGTWYESTIHFACIGIENLFVKILKDNGHTKPKYAMPDFVKLKEHLRLDEYSAILPRYPWLAPFSPYKTWDGQAPTQSLSWFHAYNKLKHDKEESYDQGTMINAIQSCLAYWILAHAVFGDEVDGRFFQNDDDDFYLVTRPNWQWRQYYFEPPDKEWRAVNVSI